METRNIKIKDNTYSVKIAISNKDKAKGLQNISKLPDNEGMIFKADPNELTSFWMKDTHIPLDLIFINDEDEVIRVVEGEPLSENIIEEVGVTYTLELNVNSGVKKGDTVDLSEVKEACEEKEEQIAKITKTVTIEYISSDSLKEEDDEVEDEEDDDFEDGVMPKLIVLDAKGKPQVELEGEERIYSRKHTKTLIRMAKRAKASKEEKDYKALGRKMFQYIKYQDDKDEDYVEIKK